MKDVLPGAQSMPRRIAAAARSFPVPLGPGIYGLGLALILLVTALTVGFETVKAAIMNPVNSLRRE